MRSVLAAFSSLALMVFIVPRAAADFEPDPVSVQYYEAAYRFPQAGWIVLHIEGQPYERGYQQGIQQTRTGQPRLPES